MNFTNPFKRKPKQLASLIHDGAVAGYSAPALLQWA